MLYAILNVQPSTIVVYVNVLIKQLELHYQVMLVIFFFYLSSLSDAFLIHDLYSAHRSGAVRSSNKGLHMQHFVTWTDFQIHDNNITFTCLDQHGSAVTNTHSHSHSLSRIYLSYKLLVFKHNQPPPPSPPSCFISLFACIHQ